MRAASIPLGLGVALLVAVIFWVMIGLGKPSNFAWRPLVFYCLVGVAIYACCRGLDDWLGPRIRRRPARQQSGLRAAVFFVGGGLGYVVGVTLGSLVLGGGVGRLGRADLYMLAILGVVATGVGLGFHFYGVLEDRLRQSAARLHEAEQAEKELALARSIQRRLQPPTEISLPGLRIVARNLPAAFVAGDFYDVFRLDDGAHGVVVADVAGKGMGAALITATVKSRLPLLAAGRSVSETLAALNASLVGELGPREFVALAYARVDVARGVVEIANAGLPDPYLLVGDAPPMALEVEGERLPLGVRDGVVHGTRRVALPPGARLVLLSDGLPEAPLASGEPLGYESLAAILGARAPALDAWVDGVLAAVGARSPGARSDDWTLVAVESDGVGRR